MADFDVPAGMALACRTCRWRPGVDLPIGLVAAHFETEHGTDAVTLDLIVVCGKDDSEMPHQALVRGKDIFQCPRCHRIRSIRHADG